MTEGAVVWLAIMAVALVIMAVVQIGLIIVALRVAREVNKTNETVRREVRPLLDKLNGVADEAARVTSLAFTQVERVDRALSSTARQLDTTLTAAQAFVAGPLRQGSAVLAGVKAAVSVVRHMQGRRRTRRDADEDALFVG